MSAFDSNYFFRSFCWCSSHEPVKTLTYVQFGWLKTWVYCNNLVFVFDEGNIIDEDHTCYIKSKVRFFFRFASSEQSTVLKYERVFKSDYI
jgi:hypothetical protein